MKQNFKTKIKIGRKPSIEDRRKEILDATMEVIAQSGLSATTIEKVADRIGISPGTVVFHFPKKNDLLLAVLDHLSVEFEHARKQAIEDAGGDPVRALKNIVDVNFDKVLSRQDKVAVWYAFWGEAKARKVYMSRVGRFDAVYHEDIVGLFHGLAAEARRVHPTNPVVLADGFVGLMEWLWQTILIEGRAFNRPAAKRHAISYLASIFPEFFDTPGEFDMSSENEQTERTGS